MKRNIKEVKVGSRGYYGIGELGLETKSTFKRASMNRKYVKILLQCLDYTHITKIYPNVKNPLEQQLRDMCRVGLLGRYEINNERGYYYKTTNLGKELLINVIKNTK